MAPYSYYGTVLQINQAYYIRLINETHKHYNYLQLILKQKLFTKVMKMQSRKAWGNRAVVLLKEGWGEIAKSEVAAFLD